MITFCDAWVVKVVVHVKSELSLGGRQHKLVALVVLIEGSSHHAVKLMIDADAGQISSTLQHCHITVQCFACTLHLIVGRVEKGAWFADSGQQLFRGV